MMEQRVNIWNRKSNTNERFPLDLSASRRLCVQNRCVAAFSLIELIGVLAILAILAALIVPVVIRQIDQAANTREAADLKAISDDLTHHILTTRTIPDPATMAQTIATWTRHPLTKITKTPRGCTRVFVTDNGGWTGHSLPWQQTTNGLTVPPARARIIIASSISQNLPIDTDELAGGDFDAMWDAADGANPNGWNTRADDLHIQRLDLTGMWHRLTMVNRDKSFAIYAISNTNLPALNPNSSRSAYYLNGTELSLCNPGGLPVQKLILTEDESFTFEGGIWQIDIGGENSSEVIAQDFAALAAKFLSAQWYTGAHQGGDQQGALVAMFDFMLVYSMWANQCPHFPNHGVTKANVPEYEMLMDLGGNGTVSRINEFTGTDGLLK